MAKRLGFNPAEQDSEGDEEAVAAGLEMRERQRALLTQVPELPDRYDPTSVRAPSPHSDAPPAKLRRVHLASTSDAEDLPSESRTEPDTTPFRLNSDSEAESTRHTYDPVTQFVVDILELEGPRVTPVRPPLKAKPIQPPVEPSGPSHGGTALAAPTPRETQRRFSSDDEAEWVRPRRVRRHRTHTRVANPFIQFEAKEGDDEESGSESESASRAEPAQNTLHSSVSSDADSDSDSIFDSDSDSN